MRAITILTIALLATSIVPLGFNQNAYASHFLIDDFSAAAGGTSALDSDGGHNPGVDPAQGPFGSPNSGTDTGLAGVVDGQRFVELRFDGPVPPGPGADDDVHTSIAGSMFTFSTDGPNYEGSFTLTYDDSLGDGLNLNLEGDDTLVPPITETCSINLNVFATNAQGVTTGILTLKDGSAVSESSSAKPLSSGGGDVVFPIAEFTTVDLTDIDSISIAVDAAPGINVVLNAVEAVDCVVVGGTGPTAVALFLANAQLIGAMVLPVIGASAIAVGVVATRRNK